MIKLKIFLLLLRKFAFQMKYFNFTAILGLSLGTVSAATATEVHTDLYVSAALGNEIRPSVPHYNFKNQINNLLDPLSAFHLPDLSPETVPFGDSSQTSSSSFINEDTFSTDISELYENPFGLQIPAIIDPYELSHKKHCDVLRHLKVPATRRRLDAYMKPHYILKKHESIGKFTTGSDQLFSSKARQDLYREGVDIYGCYALDFAADIVSNLSNNPIAKGTTGPWHTWQGNSTLILGVDIYSRLLNENWKGGQWHTSFTYPDALNDGPLYSYGNTLNPAGLGTRMYQGYFYSDVGRNREGNASMQGARIFENWVQQSWGPMGLNYLRVGAINPWITFNRSLAAGIFSFWTFDEPGVIGTTPSTQNGPLFTTAPPGISVALQFGDNLLVKGMAASGYWDPSGGTENRRGYNMYLDFDHWGVEYLYEATWRGGTYSLDPSDHGKPWFVRLGGQYHSGMGLHNLYTEDELYYFPADRCDESVEYGGVNSCNIVNTPDGYANRKKYYGNSQYYFMAEAMLYREKDSYNRGLTGFFKAKYSPWEFKGSSTRLLTAGLVYEGIGSRDNDLLYFGYSHMMFNQGVHMRVRRQNACLNMPHCKTSGFQGVFETGYSMQVTPYFFIQPKLYYVMNPNLRSDLGDIFTAGIELRLSL